MLDVCPHSPILSTVAFDEGRKDWPEGAIYRYDRSGHELLRVVRSVDDNLAASVATGAIDLALIVTEPLIVVCSRVEGVLPWAGASFHWHRVRRGERVLPLPGRESLLDSTIDLMLLEGQGGRVRATRPLRLPADFARILHDAILEQSRFPYDPGEERRALAALIRRCPEPGSLLAYASAKVRLPG